MNAHIFKELQRNQDTKYYQWQVELIFCNCFAVIAYMIIETEMDFNPENQITPMHSVLKVLLG